MREALSALTIRGRAFLAAGGTAFVCALVLGHDELVRVSNCISLTLPYISIRPGRDARRRWLAERKTNPSIARNQIGSIEQTLFK